MNEVRGNNQDGNTEAPALAAEVDRVIDQALSSGRIVGPVELIARDGKVVYQRAAGLADREAGRPMRLDTLFRLASLTKPIVSAAAMILIERGQLAPDDPVIHWLPAFRPALPNGERPPITVRQLLTHTSGLNGGTGLVGTAPEFLHFLETLRSGGALVKPDTAAAMMRNQVGDLPVNARGPGWGFGFGASVLKDPEQAGSPHSAGAWGWGGVYGHSWFIDPAQRLTVVGLTNTAIEGMAGRFPTDLRNVVYRWLAQC